MRKQLSSAVVLGLVPLLLPILAVYFNHTLTEFDADPSYAYLLNGLSLVYFHTPSLYSHPGTPVELLSAVIIAFVWFGRAISMHGGSPQVDVLRNPEIYLWWINTTFAVMGGLAIYFLGRRLYAATGRFSVAIVAELSFFLSVPLLSSGIVNVMPEALLVSLTALLAAIAVPLIFSDRPSPEGWRYPALVGLVIGACVASKVTAGPLIFTAFFFNERRQILTGILASIIGTILFTLPVAAHYGAIADWIFQILTHSGHDGTGPVAAPSIAVLWQNLQNLFHTMPEMFITLGACIALGITWKGEQHLKKARFRRLFLVSAAIIGLELAMLTKHPGDYYIAPAVASMALANAGLTYFIVLGENWRYRVCAAAAMVLVAFGLWRGLTQATAAIAIESASRNADLDFLNKFANPSSGCALVYYYNVPVQPFKLLFGNGFADRLYSRTLATIYPSFISYNPGVRLFETFGGGLVTPGAANHILARDKCVHLVGSSLDRYGNDFGIPPQSTTFIARAVPDAVSAAVYDLRMPLPDTLN